MSTELKVGFDCEWRNDMSRKHGKIALVFLINSLETTEEMK